MVNSRSKQHQKIGFPAIQPFAISAINGTVMSGTQAFGSGIYGHVFQVQSRVTLESLTLGMEQKADGRLAEVSTRMGINEQILVAIKIQIGHMGVVRHGVLQWSTINLSPTQKSVRLKKGKGALGRVSCRNDFDKTIPPGYFLGKASSCTSKWFVNKRLLR